MSIALCYSFILECSNLNNSKSNSFWFIYWSVEITDRHFV